MLLFALFVLVPIVEIALFIQVGGAIGLWPTLGIVVATALAGTLLMRWQGQAALDRLQTDLRRGADPGATLVQGAAILVAGVLLLTPGFFTDGLGLALLFPPTRALLLRLALQHFVPHGVRRHPGAPDGGPPGAGPDADVTIEGEYTVLGEDRPDSRRAGRGG